MLLEDMALSWSTLIWKGAVRGAAGAGVAGAAEEAAAGTVDDAGGCGGAAAEDDAGGGGGGAAAEDDAGGAGAGAAEVAATTAALAEGAGGAGAEDEPAAPMAPTAAIAANCWESKGAEETGMDELKVRRVVSVEVMVIILIAWMLLVWFGMMMGIDDWLKIFTELPESVEIVGEK